MSAGRPRGTRQAGPPVPSIRLLGTSWYRRGAGYWLRRAGLTFVYLVLLGLVGLFIGGLVAAIVSGTTGTGRVVLLLLAGAVVVASYVQAIRAARSRRRVLTPEQRRGQQQRRRVTGGAGLGAGVGASAGSVVGAAFLFVGSLAVVGTISVIFVQSLGRHLDDDERAAVASVAAWRQRHPDQQS